MPSRLLKIAFGGQPIVPRGPGVGRTLPIVDRVKLIDVAAAAGVHPGTASRALNPATRDQVSRETSRRVLATAKRMGYVPNTLARGLRTARSYVVGMVVPDITNPLFPPMVRGVEQVLSDAGYTLVLTDTDNDAVTERRQVEQLKARGADGFVIATARWEDSLLDEIAAAGTPSVLVNRYTASRALPYVGGDERTGVRLAVEHLVGIGHRRIVYVAGPQDTSTGRERSAAFRQAVRANGLAARARLVTAATAYTESAGAVATRRLLEATTDFTAIMAGNDLIALGVLSVLTERGISCPDDMSVVGFNDLPMVDKLSPPLTTVRLPLHAIGATAGRILLSRMDGTPAADVLAQSLLGVELAVRGSTAPPRTVG